MDWKKRGFARGRGYGSSSTHTGSLGGGKRWRNIKNYQEIRFINMPSRKSGGLQEAVFVYRLQYASNVDNRKGDRDKRTMRKGGWGRGVAPRK